MNAITKLWVLCNGGDFLNSVEPVTYSGNTLFHGASWLVVWLVDWLVNWLVNCLVGWFVS